MYFVEAKMNYEGEMVAERYSDIYEEVTELSESESEDLELFLEKFIRQDYTYAYDGHPDVDMNEKVSVELIPFLQSQGFTIIK